MRFEWPSAAIFRGNREDTDVKYLAIDGITLDIFRGILRVGDVP